ncbi:hypothetical protein SAMN06295967_108176 [Belliella buryatensis]|uniref:Uncharacterized protein n=1 Tax=Belliella buryatensis TaxID=1500549 RepID=A0A239E5L0_9BACT|nr:hypothetical protein SAMN06295967_108176 [Belliella buryatensis]
MCVFALYHFGYHVFYYSFNLQIESLWTERVFEEKNEVEYMMEIPLAVPYMSDQQEFQVINTPFEKNGQNYRAIKQRYANDTLQVIYVVDTSKTRLNEAVKKWVASLVSDEMPRESNNSLIYKIFIKDYFKPDSHSLVLFGGNELHHNQGFIFSNYSEEFLNQTSPPPELV